ncbi:MAG: DUF72 domain-containing protein [Armatimonadetes bacterium]|nr:DUF72 domain-containing protein [Armatimonadota bacterium]
MRDASNEDPVATDEDPQSPDARRPSPILIGTSGFSYDDWNGPFYPKGVPKRRWFEFYAAEFPCLEVNASYYSWLSARASESLASRAPAGFRFSIKLHKNLTHDREELREGARATLEQNRPFVERGSLAVHLAQFPYSFRPGAVSWDYIERLADAVRPLCIEFRNVAWQRPETTQQLHDLRVSMCVVDEPRLRGLMTFEPIVTAPPAYVRFHGRNAQKWFRHEEAWERYDYLYSTEELAERAPYIMKLAKQSDETFLFFNNHYGAQAVTNARQMAETLGVALPGQRSLFGERAGQ